MPSSIALIVNPAAGGGRGARRTDAAVAAFAPLGATLHRTTAAGEEARLALAALDAGADTIVVLGGDGTWGRVTGAIVGSGTDARLALLAAGTGNDFVKTLGAPAHDFGAMARLVAAGAERRIDAGRAGDVVFLNSVGFAFDAAVIDRMRRARNPGSVLTYIAASLGILFGYPGIEARIDDGPWKRHLALVLANGRHFGGSFVIAPGAELADGTLEAVTIDAPLGTLARAATFAACTRGAHVGRPQVSAWPVARTTLAFRAPPLFEADGELYEPVTSEIVVECLPGALRIVA